MIVLWAMSLWAAAVMLAAAGFGLSELRREGLSRRTIVLIGCLVWFLGWWPSLHLGSGWIVNLGFVGAGAAALGLLLGWRSTTWSALCLFLALVAAIVRLAVPFAVGQAGVLPQATVESVGVGAAAGIAVGRPAPAALVGGGAEWLSALLVGTLHPHRHDLGLHDLAVVMLALLSAWVIGWLASGLTARLGRPA